MVRVSKRFITTLTSLVLFLGVTACSHIRQSRPCNTEETTQSCTQELCADKAAVCHNPTMTALAHDLDHLEKHIERFGSVTSKIPDVWGQARLTQYREDFEQEMAKDLSVFEAGLQGSFQRSDQSYLAASMALGMAVQPKAPTIGSLTTGAKAAVPKDPTPVEIVTTTTSEIKDTAKDPTKVEKTETKTTSKTPEAKPAEKGPEKIATPDAADLAKAISEPASKFSTSKVELKQIKYAGGDNASIGIEPTERLAQKKRYLDLLAQLRRENEGSDTADSPGYQLNLIRLPVNVLPGERTDTGHGAEVTFTIDPILGDDLLPTTFRRMLINDIAEQFGLPLTEAFYLKELVKQLSQDTQRTIRFITRLNDLIVSGNKLGAKKIIDDLRSMNRDEFDRICYGKIVTEDIKKYMEDTTSILNSSATESPFKLSELEFFKSKRPANTDGLDSRTRGSNDSMSQILLSSTLNFSTGLDNRQPFPTSQIFDAYGEAFVFEIAFAAQQAIGPDSRYREFVHLPDVQSFLKEESKSTSQFLAKHPELMQNFCTKELAAALRSRNGSQINAIRIKYRRAVEVITNDPELMADENKISKRTLGQFSLTSALGWVMIANASLLNDRLMQDMKESATAKGVAPIAIPGDWPQFYLPDPPPEARLQFNEYVKMRWPIHVFALDPMIQEQNIVDSLSTRRETQLALAVAFTNGAINSKTFMNAARRLESDAQTIALNRTQVGFAHGENTFGWRFYPRFQTMPTQSNLTTFFRDQLVGGPNTDAMLRNRRLEPGPRECVALVIMPSFVPYVSVDVVSNWFSLAHPKHKLLDHSQAVALSRTVKTLERCKSNVSDADCYRDQELKRMMTRVKQLGERLPTQTLTVPVPIVNTNGGFEMFSNGTSDLAPQLFGFYGAPGLSKERDTTIFLVGDHFSPLRTKVIVGGYQITMKDSGLKMMSRQVLQATVPAGCLSLEYENQQWVHAHVATPYGVSREVHIPLISKDIKAETAAAARKPESYSIPDNTKLVIRYEKTSLNPVVNGVFAPKFLVSSPTSDLKFNASDYAGLVPQAVVAKLEFDYENSTWIEEISGTVQPTRSGREVVFAKAEIENLLLRIVKKVPMKEGLSVTKNPLDTPLVTKKVTLSMSKNDGVKGVLHGSFEVTGKLMIEFKAEVPKSEDPKKDPPKKESTPPKE
ncbi:MAG: hypothetical protein ACRC8S_07510 [Fimbriiglobus sp.]